MIPMTLLYVLIGLIIVLPLFIKILREYERAVMFTLGRFTGVKGPGLIIMIPLVQQMERVDLRTVVMDVPSQDVMVSLSSEPLRMLVAAHSRLGTMMRNSPLGERTRVHSSRTGSTSARPTCSRVWDEYTMSNSPLAKGRRRKSQA